MKSKFENHYKMLLEDVLYNGTHKMDRTGVGTRMSFGEHLKINLTEGFPVITGRKIYPKNFIAEALWMLRGERTIKFLKENGVNIWDAWADKYGNLGPVYGYQLRSFDGQWIDQIKDTERLIKEEPNSRRILLSMWNPNQLSLMALPPCPFAFQFVIVDKMISIQVYIRSSDLFVGLPYDISVYATILQIFATKFNLVPYQMAISIADAHIYNNHIKLVREYLNSEDYKLPDLRINIEVNDLKKLEVSNFELKDYQYDLDLKPKVAV